MKNQKPSCLHFLWLILILLGSPPLVNFRLFLTAIPSCPPDAHTGPVVLRVRLVFLVQTLTLAFANGSRWSMKTQCATIIPMSFSSSVSHKSGNSRNASCGQYIGNACAEAWTQAFATAPISQALGCRTPPSLSGIDECKDIGTASSGELKPRAVSSMD